MPPAPWSRPTTSPPSRSRCATPTASPLGHTTIAEGWPYVSHVAAADETLTTSVEFTGTGDVVVADTPTGRWGLRLDGATVDGRTISLGEGDSVVLFPVPADGDADAIAEHAVPLTGTSASYSVGADEVTTELTYDTAGGTTAFGVLPHQASTAAEGCDLGTFPTVYGTQTLCAGSTLTWSAPRQQAALGLDLSGLSDDDRAELATQVAADVADLPDPPADTYFGAKWTYRTAQLLDIARQVGADDAADQARTRLSEVLLQWAEVDGCVDRSAFCFGYDPEWKGDRRADGGVRLRAVQRPPLPLRLLPLRRRRPGQRPAGAGGPADTGDDPARR